MNTLNKNRQSGFGKAFSVWLGCAVVFTGLALPAYGQVTVTPTCSGATGENPLPVATGTDGNQTGDDASSFAAGCGANAGTDGSVTIGDNAKVEKYDVITVVEAGPGVPTHTYDPDGAGTIVGKLVEVSNGMIYETNNGVRGALIGTIGESQFEATNPAYGLVKATGPGTPGSTRTVKKGDFAIAIGTNAKVVGEDSIAIGHGASTLRENIIKAGPGVPTHMYDQDGAGTTHSGRLVEVANGMIYETSNGVRGTLIGTIGETQFETANPAYGLVKATGPGTPGSIGTPDPVLQAVAIGASATVTGDNGIAIGAGVTAGENEIVIGKAGQTAIIGGVDLAGIATNRSGIDTNTKAIATNRSGIAMSVALAHLPTIKGGGWGIAVGSFDSETAVAVGALFDVQQNAFIKVGIASSNSETSFGIGYGKGF